jgi:hypothetical protein
VSGLASSPAGRAAGRGSRGRWPPPGCPCSRPCSPIGHADPSPQRWARRAPPSPTHNPPPTGIEETWQFKQADIAAAVPLGARDKAFDLALPELGPYACAFTRAGRHLLLGGARGHLAVMEWQRQRLTCEVQVGEAVRAVTFLHNEQFWAAAQKKYVYIYDKRGLEVHCLKDHTQPAALEFLPHHFLLASVGEPGILVYQVGSGGWGRGAGGGGCCRQREGLEDEAGVGGGKAGAAGADGPQRCPRSAPAPRCPLLNGPPPTTPGRTRRTARSWRSTARGWGPAA